MNEKIDILISVLIQVNGGQATKSQPSPRPKTGYEEARMKIRKAQHRKLVARVLPHKAQVD